LMVAGSALSFHQFQSVSSHISSVSRAGHRMTLLLRLDSTMVTLMSQLNRAANFQDQDHFEHEADRLLASVQPSLSAASSGLQEIAGESDRYALLVGSIQSMIEALPGRFGSFKDLARSGDWIALNARLRNQADHTDDVFETIVQQAEADLSAGRVRLIDDADRAQKRGTILLVLAAIIGLTMAVLLGTMVTSSITRPLADLDTGARALALGRFDHRVPVNGNDELSNLTVVFNQTAAELSRLFEEVSRERSSAEAAGVALQHRAEELGRANADLEQFAYSASHDLREPLRTLAVYSQLLQREHSEQLDETAEEYMGYIHRSARHMDQLVQDLLAYTQTAAVAPPPGTCTDIGAVLAHVLITLEVDIRAAGSKVAAGHLPKLPVHEVHAQQLLQNLIGNAIKYRSERRPEIHISAESHEGNWLFSVRDNGIGIDPKYSKHIFGIFKRLHGPKYPGTGIGLAICQRIVEGYGGRIWVESVPGQGATFRFTLPGEKGAAGNSSNGLTHH
jgi:signal transduction histidine kinase